MKQALLDLIDEQVNPDALLAELENAKDDKELLFIARKIIAKRTEFNWLKVKVNELFDSGARKDGSS